MPDCFVKFLNGADGASQLYLCIMMNTVRDHLATSNNSSGGLCTLLAE